MSQSSDLLPSKRGLDYWVCPGQSRSLPTSVKTRAIKAKAYHSRDCIFIHRSSIYLQDLNSVHLDQQLAGVLGT